MLDVKKIKSEKPLIRLTQFLYGKYLNSLKLNKKIGLYSIIHSIWKKYFSNFDPEIKIKVGNKFLLLNLSHRLPIYYNKYPKYDRALPRICKKIKEIDNRLSVIDIGANIGDTVSLITDQVTGNFLCIEGDRKYLSLLEKNIEQLLFNYNVKIEDSYCGNEAQKDFFINRTNGTARIIKNLPINTDSSSSNVIIKSLDRIIEENKDFENSNILKIDTDGFEINILKSAEFFINKSKPLIYFEFTPELYSQANQNPEEIWEVLKNYGYKEALFYDNFGNIIKVTDINNNKILQQLINKIDNAKIFYYDVLTYHNKKSQYSNIIKSELEAYK